MTKDIETVESEWGMCCPRCGRDEMLTVRVTVDARLTPHGTVTEGDQEWDDDSACRCGCGWEGKVGDTKHPQSRPVLPI